MRLAAATVIGYLGVHAKDALPELKKAALLDSDFFVREAAVRTIGKIGVYYAKDALPELKKAVLNSDAGVRRVAATVIGNLGVYAKDALSELKKAVLDSDPDVRRAAATAIGNLGVYAKPALSELVKAALFDSDSGVRWAAAIAIGNLGVYAKDALPELRKAVLNSDSGVRWAALEVIGELGVYAKDALSELKKAVLDSDPGVRWAAATAIGNLGVYAKPALSELVKAALLDSDPYVRLAATIVIGNLGVYAKDALPELRKAVLNSDAGVRLGAMRAIRELGVHAKDALPELKAALLDSNAGVRKAAARAIKQIEEDLADLPENSTAQICQAIKMISENKDWESLSGYTSESGGPSDSWDTEISSLGKLYQLKTKLRKPNVSGSCQTKNSDPVENFSKSILSLIQRSERSHDPYWSSVDIYAKIYRLNYLKLLGKTKEAKKIRISLEKDLTQLREKGIGGSAFNTYAYGAAMVALAPNIPIEILEKAKKLVDAQPDPMRLPYTPSGFPAYSRKASAARNVPFHLALYLGLKKSQKPSEAQTRKKHLIEAVLTWKKYAGNLAAEVPRDEVHEGRDYLAPYYFYSSLPYVTSAIKLLERDPTLSNDQKDSISAVKRSLRKKLPRLMEGKKLGLLPGGKNYRNTIYVSSPAYTYPLYGLALIPLLEEGDPCFNAQLKEDFGIVSLGK